LRESSRAFLPLKLPLRWRHFQPSHHPNEVLLRW
jgi:hypothetical protein